MNRFILARFAGVLVALALGLSLTAANDNDRLTAFENGAIP
jgi:hypothetical protein